MVSTDELLVNYNCGEFSLTFLHNWNYFYIELEVTNESENLIDEPSDTRREENNDSKY